MDLYGLEARSGGQPGFEALADVLVPNGVKSTKFTTSLGEHGVNTSLC